MDDHLVNGGLSPKSLRSTKEHPRPSSIAWWLLRRRQTLNPSPPEKSTVGALKSHPNRRLLSVLVVLFALAAGALAPAVLHAVWGPLKGAAAKEAALVAMATEAIAALPSHPQAPHTRALTAIPFRVAIAGIVRDDAASLPRMMALIEEIGALFIEYRVVIVENDSCDGTRQFLHAWAKRNKRVMADTHSFKAQTKRPSHGFLANRLFFQRRHCLDRRNRYLDLIMGKHTYAQEEDKAKERSMNRPHALNHSDPLIRGTGHTNGNGDETNLRHITRRRRRRNSDASQGTYVGPPNGWWHGGCHHGSCVRNAPPGGNGGPALKDCDLVLVIDMDLLAVDIEGLRLSVLAWLRAVADEPGDSSSSSSRRSVTAATTTTTASGNSGFAVSRINSNDKKTTADDGTRRRRNSELSISSPLSSSLSVLSLQFPREAKGWGGIAANGVTQDGRYFDIFALRARRSSTESSSVDRPSTDKDALSVDRPPVQPRPFLEWPPSRGVLFQNPTGRNLIRAHQVPYHPLYSAPFGVDSAFSGLAVYRRDAIRGCRYSSGEFNDCEHVAFHQCLALNVRRAMEQRSPGGVHPNSASSPSWTGHFALGVAPRMVVTYNLPCDPGPNVSVADGCFGNPTKAAEIQRFRDLQLQLRSRS